MSRYIDAEALPYSEVVINEYGLVNTYHTVVFAEHIANIPTADVKPVVHGKWERGYSFPDGEYVKCTVCGEIIKCIYPMHFCPNCGADMREVEE